MNLPHSGQNDLFRLLVSNDFDGWVLLDEPMEGGGHLVFIAFAFGSKCERYYRLRYRRRTEENRPFLITKGIPGARLFQLRYNRDITRSSKADRFLLLSHHDKNLPDSFSRALR